MSDEMRKEIIKAHIYGLSNAEIADANGVTIEEVDKVLKDTEAIEQKRKFMLESGWM